MKTTIKKLKKAIESELKMLMIDNYITAAKNLESKLNTFIESNNYLENEKIDCPEFFEKYIMEANNGTNK
jgi:hypothetical protein